MSAASITLAVVDLFSLLETAAAEYGEQPRTLGSTPRLDYQAILPEILGSLKSGKFGVLVLVNAMESSEFANFMGNWLNPSVKYNFDQVQFLDKLLGERKDEFNHLKLPLVSSKFRANQTAYIITGKSLATPTAEGSVVKIGDSLRLVFGLEPKLPDKAIKHADPVATLFVGVRPGMHTDPLVLPRVISGYETETYGEDPNYESTIELTTGPVDLWAPVGQKGAVATTGSQILWHVQGTAAPPSCVSCSFSGNLRFPGGQPLDSKFQFEQNREKNKQSTFLVVPVYTATAGARCPDPWIEAAQHLGMQATGQRPQATSEEIKRAAEQASGVHRAIVDVDAPVQFSSVDELPLAELNRAYKSQTDADLRVAADALGRLQHKGIETSQGLLATKMLELKRLLDNRALEQSNNGMSADAVYRSQKRAREVQPIAWYNQQLQQIVPDLNGRALYPAMFRGRPMQKTVLIISDDSSEATAVARWLAYVGMLHVVEVGTGIGSSSKMIVGKMRQMLSEAHKNRPAMIYLNLDFLAILPNNQEEKRKILTYFFTVLQDLMDSPYPVYFVAQTTRSSWFGPSADPALDRRFLYKLDLSQPRPVDYANAAALAALPAARQAEIRSQPTLAIQGLADEPTIRAAVAAWGAQPPRASPLQAFAKLSELAALDPQATPAQLLTKLGEEGS